MNFFNKRTIALIGAVAISAIAQPTAVFAISVQVPSASVVAGTKAEDFLIQGEEKGEGDKPGAMQDFQKAPDLFQQQCDKDNYERTLNNLRELQ